MSNLREGQLHTSIGEPGTVVCRKENTDIFLSKRVNTYRRYLDERRQPPFLFGRLPPNQPVARSWPILPRQPPKNNKDMLWCHPLHLTLCGCYQFRRLAWRFYVMLLENINKIWKVNTPPSPNFLLWTDNSNVYECNV